MESSAQTVAIFSEFLKHINEEQDKREEIRSTVRELEQKALEILSTLQAVHQPQGLKSVKEICCKARESFGDIQQKFASLSQLVVISQYYRFHDHWKFVLQRLSFLCAFIVYLETETMIGRDDCAKMIGVCAKREEGFHLDLDDYLIGLLQLATELSRLSVNAVTYGEYERPTRIAQFLGDLDTGFRLLNLKNDALRKRFDGLKYNLKKVEEVVYDVAIRGLASTQSPPQPKE